MFSTSHGVQRCPRSDCPRRCEPAEGGNPTGRDRSVATERPREGAIATEQPNDKHPAWLCVALWVAFFSLFTHRHLHFPLFFTHRHLHFPLFFTYRDFLTLSLCAYIYSSSRAEGEAHCNVRRRRSDATTTTSTEDEERCDEDDVNGGRGAMRRGRRQEEEEERCDDDDVNGGRGAMRRGRRQRRTRSDATRTTSRGGGGAMRRRRRQDDGTNKGTDSHSSLSLPFSPIAVVTLDVEQIDTFHSSNRIHSPSYTLPLPLDTECTPNVDTLA